MRPTLRPLHFWLPLLCTLCSVARAEPPEPPPAPPAHAEAADGNLELPHLRIDREQRFVEIEAEVVMRDGGWLELIACSPGTREHESILTAPVRPSHLHLALILVGLEPGRPMSWRQEGDQFVTEPASGPLVKVEVVEIDGQPVDPFPVGRWVKDRNSDTTLEDTRFLFTGSRLHEIPAGTPATREGERQETDKQVYVADLEGSLISIVHFGDEVLGRQTDRTHMTDEEAWGPHTRRIPPLETPVVLRLTPVKEAKGEKEPP